MTSALRSLPSVDRLLLDERVATLARIHPRPLIVDLARASLDRARQRIRDGRDAVDVDWLVEAIRGALHSATRPSLRPVINATGVVIHTNLGRAPLSEAAVTAMGEVGAGYSNLEFDLATGTRGSRHELVSELARRLSGAEDALVVNNCAAALLLILATFAVGREVIVSRGELVEIGGGVRIPDVLRESGARLVEVGTTNRTYAADFATAVSDQTAMLLRVHTSNFRVIGFVHAPEPSELAAVAGAAGVLLVDDLGSGSFIDTSLYGLAREPMVQEAVTAGADLVCFSGDKLLGGPQAGVIVGQSALVARLRRSPLTRALRPDKVTLAALGATLAHYVRGEAEREVPVWRMIALSPDDIERRARAIVAGLGEAGQGWTVEDGRSAIGGGSLPGETLPTRLLSAPSTIDAAALCAALRAGSPAVVGRVERARAVFDLRTVLPAEDSQLSTAIVEALRCVS